MTSATNTGTRNTSLKFAEELSKIVNQAWESGEFLSQVSLITSDLLRYWFEDSFIQMRNCNFHEGQKQAILNAIYVHEVLKSHSVSDMYTAVGQTASNTIVDSDFLGIVSNDTYNLSKYCIKMATGTGKTWVLQALLVWQYLNAKHTFNSDVQYTKNFLVVTPGLIVYERLLDAFRGKEGEDKKRNFDTADLKCFQDLFIPEKYRQDVFSFVQSSVADKIEIGHKVTGDGIIAITNWHALIDDTEETKSDIDIAGIDLSKTKELAEDVLPIKPGIASGNSLETLDNRFLRGGLVQYLAGLPNICVFNDEAHHIHENKSYGEVEEVKWLKALNTIANGKNANFIQVDFSATPYNVTGSGARRTKHYFPHIISNFELSKAMRIGLVKTFLLDERKEVASLANEDMEFKAIRDDRNKVIDLSDGQRLMLRAGLSKLKILEEEFVKHDNTKHPKLMVVCEDTDVSPLVADFLRSEGLSADDIMQVDSTKKGELKSEEWETLKQKLFNLDKQTQPKVVVSVLMLREGFDVDNICVIVSLRSTEAPILLEQVLGRGLRLMWRDKAYEEVKAENRHRIYDEKEAPINYLDTLFVVEHPAFKKFYEDLDKNLIIGDKGELPEGGKTLGDIVTANLKDGFEKYDMFWPVIIQDKEETLNGTELSVQNMQPLTGWTLAQLKQMVPNDNAERFISQELQVQTRFGEYKVKGDIFTAKSYNEYLQKMLNAIISNMVKVSVRGKTKLPLMQIDQSLLVATIDKFIRTRLFNEPFDPMVENNWRVLIVTKAQVIEHTMKELSKAIYEMHNNVDVHDSIVEKHYFSSIPSLIGRDNFSLNIVKSIYDKTFYPSNKGGLEKDFLEACDADGEVERLIKINENKHTFAKLRYLRSDGMLATYYPDFMVKLADKIYIVETKASNQVDNPDVKQKKIGAVDWINKINELTPEQRMNSIWAYVLLTDTNFYARQAQNAGIKDILEMSKMTRNKAEGVLV